MSQSFTSMDARTQPDQRVVVYRDSIAELIFSLEDVKKSIETYIDPLDRQGLLCPPPETEDEENDPDYSTVKDVLEEVLETLTGIENSTTPDNMPEELLIDFSK